MDTLIKKLQQDFPGLSFEAGSQHFWSPHDQRVTYTIKSGSDEAAAWSLLHEVGHAVLKHRDYESDFELLQMEAAAWQKACELGKKYGIDIDEGHVQDCLDTYRDWLHRRSACPVCGNHSLQTDSRTYRCFNCKEVWKVSVSRFCRPYRMKTKTAAETAVQS